MTINCNWCIVKDKHHSLFFFIFFLLKGKRSEMTIAPPYAWLNKAISGYTSSKLQYYLCRWSLWSWKESLTSPESVFIINSSFDLSPKNSGFANPFSNTLTGSQVVNEQTTCLRTSATCGESDFSRDLISGQQLQGIDGRWLLILLCSTSQSDVKASIDSELILGTPGDFSAPTCC